MSTLAVVERAAWRAARDAYVVRSNARRSRAHPIDLAAIEAYCQSACLAWAELRLAADLETGAGDCSS